MTAAPEHPTARARATDLVDVRSVVRQGVVVPERTAELALASAVAVARHLDTTRITACTGVGSFVVDLSSRTPISDWLGRIRSGRPIDVRADPNELHRVVVLPPGGSPRTVADQRAITIVFDGWESGKLSIRVHGKPARGLERDRVASHVGALIATVSEHGASPIGAWPMLGDEERRIVVDEWNATDRAFPSEMKIHGWFERSAARQPDTTAVIDTAGAIEYGALDLTAERIADCLRSMGCRGTRVGILCERSRDLPIALLGCAKAGGVYVPMEPGWPASRLHEIAQTAEIGAWIASESLVPLLRDGLGTDRAVVTPSGRVALTGPALVARSEMDDAYVIFTSGSTGRPKGVRVSHRAVANLIDWVNREYAVGPTDRVLMVASAAFDLSVYDLFGTFAAGGSVRIADDSERRDPTRLAEIVKTESITFWDSTPALLDQVVAEGRRIRTRSNQLRLVFQSGDWIRLGLPEDVASLYPNARFVALGGATEAAVWSNVFDVDRVCSDWASIPYGRPIQNARYYVLDRSGQPCPVGVPGELFISGVCVAEGYASEPDRTRERFTDDPFRPGQRMYRTGDLARWRSTGTVELLGRLDRQVKINGHRVEPGEIEARCLEFEGVSRAVALSLNGDSGPRLVAFVRSDDPALTPDVVHSRLRDRLPSYMVPSIVRMVDSIPITENGKIDVVALAASIEQRPSEALAEPVSGTERRDGTAALIAAEFQRELGTDAPDASRDFFAAGGDSLAVMRAVHGLRSRGLSVSVADVYKGRTAAGVAAAMAARSSSSAADVPTDNGGEIGVTPTQSWILSRAFGDVNRYNEAFVFRLPSRMNAETLESMCDDLVRRYDALRLRFVRRSGKWLQRAEPAASATCSVVDAPSCPDEHDALIRQIGLSRRCSLDVSSGRVFDAVLFNAPDGMQSSLLLVLHHLCIDAVSMSILSREIEHRVAGGLGSPAAAPSFIAWASSMHRSASVSSLDGPWCSPSAEPASFDNTYGSSASVRATGSCAGRDRDVEESLLARSLGVLSEALGSREIEVGYTGHGREPIEDVEMETATVVGCLTTVVPILLTAPIRGSSQLEANDRETLRAARNHGAAYGWDDATRSVAPVAAPLKFNFRSGTGRSDRMDGFAIPGVLDPSDPRAYLVNVDASRSGDRVDVSLRYPRSLWSETEALAALTTIVGVGGRA